MEPLRNLVESPAARAIGWALFHSLWQVALLGLVLLALLTLSRRRDPQVRYVLSCIILLAMVMVPVVTGWVSYHSERAGALAPVEGGVSKWEPEGRMPVAPPEGAVAERTPTTVVSEAGAAAKALSPRAAYAPSTPPRQVIAATVRRWEAIRAALAPVVPWCVCFWLAGLVLMTWRNVASWLGAQRLRTRGVSPAPAWVCEQLSILARQMGMRRNVLCVHSVLLPGPATLGWLRPMILLPASTVLGLEPNQLASILAHELAHIRRHDYLVNLCQTAAESLLFYHPVVWWVSGRIRTERELCCDDIAVAVCKDPAVYVEALARIGLMQHAPRLAVAAGGSSLLVRIRRLAQQEAVGPARPASAFLSMAIVVCACASLFGPNVSAIFVHEPGHPPGARRITFPEWTMGQLMIRPWGSALHDTWEPYQPAMGAVDVPAGMEVQLVADNNAVTDLEPLSYLAAEDLQSINFKRTEIHDEQLAHIKGLALRELDFELTEITNGALQYLDDMTTLERLSVGRTNVDNEGMGHLSALTGLRQLDLNLTGVNDDGLAQLEGLRELEYLDLWNARITDDSLRWIGNLTNLQILGLEGTLITDEGLARLRGLHRLERLVLEKTPVSDDGVRYIAEIPTLNEIGLRNTRITDGAIEILLANLNLKGLSLPNQISPAALNQLEGIEVVSRQRGDMVRTIRVVDQAGGTPVPMARIELRAQPHYGRFREHYYWTGDAGDIEFYYGESHVVDLTVHAEGYVPQAAVWNLPEEEGVTVALARAVTIGGTIVNESGVAVGGVAVGLSLPGERDYDLDAIGIHTETTNEDGVWRCGHAPAEPGDLSIALTHPDYAGTVYTAAELTYGRLRNGAERLVIGHGISVAGRVLDTAGQPITGASVTEMALGRGDLFAATDNIVWTDENGAFRMENQPVGPVTLKVNAGGYLPALKEVTFSAAAEPITFALKTGMLLRGRVVDHEGKPIERAIIETSNHIRDGYNDHLSTVWRTVTDQDGRFYWDEAPEGAVRLLFAREGYTSTRKEVRVSGEEFVVALDPRLSTVQVAGFAWDCDTGEPVSDYRVELRSAPGGTYSKIFQADPDGGYRIDAREAGAEFTVTVEAEGFSRRTSPVYRAADGDVDFDFHLRKAPVKSGVVKTLEGEPVAGALYAVAMPLKEYRFADLLDVKNGTLDERDVDRVKQTDSEGRFSVAVWEVPAELVITHESGFARLNLEAKEEESEVILRPWARLEGAAKIASDVAANTQIYFQLENPWESAFAIVTYKTLTDNEGGFQVPRVFPGHAWVNCTTFDQGRGLVSAWTSKYVVVPEGEVVQVQIGGTGRPVKGRVLIPEERRDQIALTSVSSGRISERYAIPWPDEADTWSEEEKSQWRSEWFRTDEGKRSVRHQNAYGFILDESGAFEIPDVVPGPYQLTVYLKQVVEGKLESNYPIAATLEHTFDMPEMDQERSEEALDLGTLTVDWSDTSQ